CRALLTTARHNERPSLATTPIERVLLRDRQNDRDGLADELGALLRALRLDEENLLAGHEGWTIFDAERVAREGLHAEPADGLLVEEDVAPPPHAARKWDVLGDRVLI